MKSIYIAGPYTAESREGEDENIKSAARIAADYIKRGWAVFCPHTMSVTIDREFNKDRMIDWNDWMTMDLHWLSKCDAIHMLPGWTKSKGAVMEYMFAQALGLEIKGDRTREGVGCVMTRLEWVLLNKIEQVKDILIINWCPYELGIPGASEDCENDINCEKCWNQEVPDN